MSNLQLQLKSGDWIKATRDGKFCKRGDVVFVNSSGVVPNKRRIGWPNGYGHAGLDPDGVFFVCDYVSGANVRGLCTMIEADRITRADTLDIMHATIGTPRTVVLCSLAVVGLLALLLELVK